MPSPHDTGRPVRSHVAYKSILTCKSSVGLYFSPKVFLSHKNKNEDELLTRLSSPEDLFFLIIIIIYCFRWTFATRDIESKRND